MKRHVLIGVMGLLALIGFACAPGSGERGAAGQPPGGQGDPLNVTYRIDGQEIRLQGGRFEAEAAPGSAEKIHTSVFGQPVYGDLDDDGDADAALLLTHRTGGSGSFMYVAAALNTGGTSRGTNAILLGDRVAPKNLEIRSGVVVVDYDDRRPGEPMAVSPSVGKTLYLAIRSGVLTPIGSQGKGEPAPGEARTNMNR